MDFNKFLRGISALLIIGGCSSEPAKSVPQSKTSINQGDVRCIEQRFDELGIFSVHEKCQELKTGCSFINEGLVGYLTAREVGDLDKLFKEYTSLKENCSSLLKEMDGKNVSKEQHENAKRAIEEQSLARNKIINAFKQYLPEEVVEKCHSLYAEDFVETLVADGKIRTATSEDYTKWLTGFFERNKRYHKLMLEERAFEDVTSLMGNRFYVALKDFKLLPLAYPYGIQLIVPKNINISAREGLANSDFLYDNDWLGRNELYLMGGMFEIKNKDICNSSPTIMIYKDTIDPLIEVLNKLKTTNPNS